MLFRPTSVSDRAWNIFGGSSSSSRESEIAFPGPGLSSASMSGTSWKKTFMARCTVLLWRALELEYRRSGLKTQSWMC
jgi:hypothetical protein